MIRARKGHEGICKGNSCRDAGHGGYIEWNQRFNIKMSRVFSGFGFLVPDKWLGSCFREITYKYGVGR